MLIAAERCHLNEVIYSSSPLASGIIDQRSWLLWLSWSCDRCLLHGNTDADEKQTGHTATRVTADVLIKTAETTEWFECLPPSNYLL